MDTFNFPSRSLYGRVAIVTGADFDKRITNGCAIAIMLARDGCNVICVGMPLSDSKQPQPSIERTVSIINGERAKNMGPGPTERKTQQPQAQTQIQTQSQSASFNIPGGISGRAVAFECDITDEDQCDDAVQFALDTFGRLDILVNNTGINGPPGTAIDVDMDDWAYAMDFNVASMVRMAKFAVPAMQVCGGKSGKAKSGGSIINMSNVSGLRGGASHLLYPTTKSAVVGMSKTMAGHFGPMGIRVNCVCPGIQYAPATFGEETLQNLSLLGTEGTSGDVAAAVVFLASDLSRWITGTKIVVDAGATSVVHINLPKPESKPSNLPKTASPGASLGVNRPVIAGLYNTSNGNGQDRVGMDGNDIKTATGVKQPVNGVKRPVSGMKQTANGGR